MDSEADKDEGGEREEEGGRERRDDLHQRLRDAGKSGTEADGDPEGRPDDGAEDQQRKHAGGRRETEQRRVTDLSKADA